MTDNYGPYIIPEPTGHWHECEICAEPYECFFANCDDFPHICEECEADENDGITSDYIDEEEDSEDA